jgi:hypothetical protein
VGGIENRLRRLEEKAPARELEPSPSFVKLTGALDEFGLLKGSRAVHYRAGRRIEPEDIPQRVLGPGHTHAQLLTLAAERAAARTGAEAFPLEHVPAVAEALMVLHEATGGELEAEADREA